MTAWAPPFMDRQWRPADEFHRLIRHVAEERLTPAEAVAILGDAPAGADPSAIVDDLARTLAADMGADRARLQARAVMATACPASSQSAQEVAGRVCGVFAAEALAFAELLGSFLLSLSDAARLRPFEQIVFLARDAIPLYVIAAVLARRGLPLPPLRLLDLNRGMFPAFPDRLSPDSAGARRLRAYIGEGTSEPVALVDTGVYGTLIRGLDDIAAFPTTEVFFLFSKHPRHQGFLNHLAAAAGPMDERVVLIEAICDTVECWPKPYETSRLVDSDHGPVAVAQATDPVSQLASFSIYVALARWAARVPLDSLGPWPSLERLARNATPLMLRDPLPEWELAGAWLGQEETAPLAAG